MSETGARPLVEPAPFVTDPLIWGHTGGRTSVAGVLSWFLAVCARASHL